MTLEANKMQDEVEVIFLLFNDGNSYLEVVGRMPFSFLAIVFVYFLGSFRISKTLLWKARARLS